MRAIIRTVSLILVFGLQSVCLGAKAEKSTLDITESVERYVAAAQKQVQDEIAEALTEAKKEMSTVKEEMEAIEWEFDSPLGKWRATSTAPTPPSSRVNNALSIITDKFGSDSAENVLVIPAGEMAGEQLGEIIEDMNIMSRIFEKNLEQADKLSASRFYFAVGRYGAGAPRNIYLEGYGALFLMEVDFPLLPLPQAEEKETEEEDVDHVWQQTKREVYQPTDNLYFKIESEDEQEAYDAAKVQDLKSKLIKNLKHAANIRNLKSTESIIVAVTGSGGQASEFQINVGGGGGYGGGGRFSSRGSDEEEAPSETPAGMRGGRGGRAGRHGGAQGGRAVGGRGGRAGGSRTGAVGGRGGRTSGGSAGVRGARFGSGGFGGGFIGGLNTTSASATVLTVRAKKSDVDAFAKGKLDFDKFQKRVQMFTY